MPARRPSCRLTMALFDDETTVAAEFIAGVDEVGRGPLAGPVVTAAVILDPAATPDGLADSKALDRATRERLYLEIIATSAVGIASSGPQAIERLNIRGATLDAMRRAVMALPRRPRLVLVDGRDVPPGLPCPARAIVGGDGSVAAIAAASIVAKVTRDRMMARLAQVLPEYGFERHVGYGTPEHQEALRRHGPTRHHRRSFAPIRALLDAIASDAGNAPTPVAEDA